MSPRLVPGNRAGWRPAHCPDVWIVDAHDPIVERVSEAFRAAATAANDAGRSRGRRLRRCIELFGRCWCQDHNLTSAGDTYSSRTDRSAARWRWSENTKMSYDTHRRTANALKVSPPFRRRLRVFLLAVVALVLGGGAMLPYYVDALWFESLGYTSVFWTKLNLQLATFGATALITFLMLYGAFLALKPPRLDDLIGGAILINRQRVKLPIESVAKLIALGLSLAIAVGIGDGMMGHWT